MTRKILSAIIFITLYSLSLHAKTVAISGLSWYDNLNEGLKAAAAENKNIYIYFTGGKECGWCVKIKKDTFANSTVQDKYLKKVVRVMLNVWINNDSAALARDKKIFAKYSGNGVPFSAILDNKGETIGTFSGFLSPTDFIAKTQKIKNDHAEYLTVKNAIANGATGYESLWKLFKICQVQNRTMEVLKLAVKLRSIDPDNKKGHGAKLEIALGIGFLTAQEYSKAVSHFQKVIDLDPDNKLKMKQTAITKLVYFYYTQKKYKKLIKWAKEGLVITGTSKYIKAWLNLLTGIGYKHLGDTVLAKKHLETSGTLAPGTKISRHAAQLANQL